MKRPLSIFPRYSKLPLFDVGKDHEAADTLPIQSKRTSSVVLLSIVKGLVLFLALVGLLASPITFQAFMEWLDTRGAKFQAATYPSCSCGGTTVAEAKSRGCIFTPLSISWLPPHCVDQELADEFDRQGPGPNGEWEYWDANMTRRLSREELGLLADSNGSFLTTQMWHVTHCLYTWKKHYRSRWTGTIIERRSNGLDHIDHCGLVFAHDARPLDIATVSGIALDADEA